MRDLDALKKMRPAELDKLPRRFREYVRQLESLLEHQQQLELETPASGIVVRNAYGYGHERSLPSDATVRIYYTDPTKFHWVELKRSRERPGTVELHGSGPFTLYPNVSNTLYVQVRA